MKDRKKHSGFRIPDDYFDEFEDKLFTKLSEGHIPKESGFRTPQGYFEQLDDKILNQVKLSEDNSKVISIFSRKTMLYAASIAACAIVIFSLFNPAQSLDSLEKIDISSIETFIDDGMLAYDINDLTALLEEDDITELITIDDQITDESLEDYLLKNIDDTTLLIE